MNPPDSQQPVPLSQRRAHLPEGRLYTAWYNLLCVFEKPKHIISLLALVAFLLWVGFWKFSQVHGIEADLAGTSPVTRQANFVYVIPITKADPVRILFRLNGMTVYKIAEDSDLPHMGNLRSGDAVTLTYRVGKSGRIYIEKFQKVERNAVR